MKIILRTKKRKNNNYNYIPTIVQFCIDCAYFQTCIVEDKNCCDYYRNYVNNKYKDIYRKVKYSDIINDEKGLKNIFKMNKKSFYNLPIAKYNVNEKEWRLGENNIGFVNGFIELGKFIVCCFKDIPLCRINETIDFYINNNNNNGYYRNKECVRLSKSGLSCLRYV